MLKLTVGLLTLQVLVSVVSTEKTTHKNDSLYFKFHQNDYDLTYEWAEVIRVTKPEVEKLEIRVFKYNRTSPALNLTYTYNIDITNESELIVQMYRFASNEYRLFPLRFQVNYCKALENNLLGSGDFYKCGNATGCTAQKGRTYRICNWAPDQSQFPPFVPSGRYMAEIQGVYRGKEMWVMRFYAAISRSIPIL